jgi:hypothetical protein
LENHLGLEPSGARASVSHGHIYFFPFRAVRAQVKSSLEAGEPLAAGLLGKALQDVAGFSRGTGLARRHDAHLLPLVGFLANCACVPGEALRALAAGHGLLSVLYGGAAPRAQPPLPGAGPRKAHVSEMRILLMAAK